jgi:hypothetical protein
MSEIRTKPASREYRANFDRIFRKRAGVVQSEELLSCKQVVEGAIPSTGSRYDENIDWGEFRTTVCCTDDHYFGG